MKKNGFTVIELMIVLAIVGILASIVAPAACTKKQENQTQEQQYQQKGIQTR